MFTIRNFWIIILVCWLLASTWWHVCKIKELCADDPAHINETTPTLSPSPTNVGYTIADGNNFRLDLPGNFSFAKSGYVVNTNSLGGSLDSLVSYLIAHPDRTLDITGYYSPTEQGTAKYADLGVARAESIRQYLLQQGVKPTSLTTKGLERDLIFTAKGDSLYGGLDFSFGSKPASDTLNSSAEEHKLAVSEKYKSVFEPIDLYFPLGEATYIKTPDTEKFFTGALTYLKDHKDKKLLLTGHSDSSGSNEINMTLSRKRANAVKAKLEKLGISPTQLSVSAMGETQPKADNNTALGRKANRRVTVVVE
ncbi:hypothetical protein GCM10028819_00040 [Spirosoma humi]